MVELSLSVQHTNRDNNWQTTLKRSTRLKESREEKKTEENIDPIVLFIAENNHFLRHELNLFFISFVDAAYPYHWKFLEPTVESHFH